MMRRSSIFIITLNDLFFLLIIIATISFETSHCTTIMCPEIEKQALLAFKHSLKDPNNQLSSWNDEANCCMWRGVVCSNSSGHVRELHLFSVGLRGEINSSLLNMKYLNYLDLSRNDFGETIPSFIGSLVSMEYLDLTDAGFHGAIPHTIGNLSNLRSLNLRYTETYSDDLDWLSGLSKLEKLDLGHVDLRKVSNGLHVFNTLPSLSELRLAECGLDLPTTSIDIANLSSLHTLALSENHFSSLSFPRWTLQLTGLTYLDLTLNSIEGQIPTASNVTLLKTIILNQNFLKSRIPDWLYSCNNLEDVELSFNYLVGPIANDISNLSSLVHLDLSANNFNGDVPPGVCRSCNMQFLSLARNKLKGEMSDVIGNMSDCFMRGLRHLFLGVNQFSGHISDRLGNFKNLELLELCDNSISGVIPFVLGDISSLYYLDLSDNKFNGNLPESIGRLSDLELLDVSSNLLEGVVTESHFIDLKDLSLFDASRNKLTFEMTSNWIPPFQLSRLILGSTNLSGPFPSWLETQKNIYFLDLSNCGIYGLVPNWVWSIPCMNLSHNSLYGNIPDLNSVNEGIYLSSNQFSGSLPRIASSLLELDLSNNSISGGISDAICGRNTTTTDSYALEILHLGGNRLSGELPDCWMRMKNIRVLNLGDNDLYGSISPSTELLRLLHTLNLCNNRISGSIPSSILSSRELVKLDLSGNYLHGNLPEWRKANSVNLRIIILRSNMLRGRIDSDICLFTSLQILDLSHNSFYGIIPRCFHNFTPMVLNHNPTFLDVSSYFYSPSASGYGPFIESANIMTKGYQRQYDVLLPLVTSIDLSNNSLSGNIPPEFTRLVSLRMLNLSRNRLTDLIPSDIGNMKQLESLDLSVNSLTGEIPNSFTMMTFLGYLNLSDNELTGRIPESTQLQRMSASSFLGNSLCGPPLTVKCGVEGDDHHDNDAIASHKADVDWFIVLFSLGFTIGLSSFLVVMIFKKSLREAYFEMLDDVWERIILSRV